ncbi:hypothetical protein XELAEV_18011521mg [Xenopus laevis]|uniref:Uncharacterized protein n=1 Tax=Xenopus laevis TaxID=8355 RepID=A0A974DM12_XENLA|nr:hypothetical protein XELAEV_18011521mg [Xenopus laevis]
MNDLNKKASNLSETWTKPWIRCIPSVFAALVPWKIAKRTTPKTALCAIGFREKRAGNVGGKAIFNHIFVIILIPLYSRDNVTLTLGVGTMNPLVHLMGSLLKYKH